MSESVPSSITAFTNRRRTRTDSLTSFTYHEEANQAPDVEEAISDSEENPSAMESDSDEASGSGSRNESLSLRRKSSGYSRFSVEDALLHRHNSAATNSSVNGQRDRRSQKTYIINEDMTIVIAGFKTSPLGYACYLLLCCSTLGVAYLLLRWLPRWKVDLIGKATALRECSWVVIEVGISSATTTAIG